MPELLFWLILIMFVIPLSLAALSKFLSPRLSPSMRGQLSEAGRALVYAALMIFIFWYISKSYEGKDAASFVFFGFPTIVVWGYVLSRAFFPKRWEGDKSTSEIMRYINEREEKYPGFKEEFFRSLKFSLEDEKRLNKKQRGNRTY